MAENQLFRLTFIDAQFPDYRSGPNKLSAAKSAIEVLEVALRKEKGFSTRTVLKNLTHCKPER
jgi:hypothetical protein